MKYFELELNGETLQFRLKASDCVLLEKKTGKSLLDYIQDVNLTNIITLLQYMRKGSIPNFSIEDAYSLYDKLVDNGYVIETIIMNIIYPTLVQSGFLKEEQYREVVEHKKEQEEKAFSQAS